MDTPAANRNNSGTAVYRAAIDATTTTLAARACSYRTLILVVAVGIGGACLWVLFARSLAPLILLLLVGVSIGTFFLLDALRLNRWRTQLLHPWQRRELDFSALNAAIRAIPGLPGETVAAMLASLPQPADLAQERQWSVTERGQVATALAVRDRRHAISLLLKTAMMAVASIVVGLMLLFQA